MAIQYLKTIPGFNLPKPARLVAGGREDAVALRVEADLGDLALVADEDGLAGARHRVVHAGRAVRRGRHQLAARSIEAHIQNLVVVPPQGVHALPAGHIPDFAGAVNGTRNAEIGAIIELCAADFSMMALQSMYAPAIANIPDLDCMIKRASNYLLPIGIKVQTNNLSSMS
uniref:Uncharacterized protein n=1 Tax=Heterosigma akashiwo TaxID=2829 RepID=A0A6V1PPX9_HETAK